MLRRVSEIYIERYIRHTEAETEFEARRDVVLVKMAVVDEEIKVVVVAVGHSGTVVASLLCNRVRQLAAGRCSTIEDVDEAVSRLLA